MSQVKYVTVDENHDGQRIDNFLMSYFKKLPKSAMYRILRKGEVRVNKKRVEVSYRLQAGDEVRIPPVKDIDVNENLNRKIDPHKAKLLEDCVLFENDKLMIINKPSGLAVHGGSSHKVGLIETLRLMRPDEKFLELAHRLDKETSGCLLIGKKNSVLKELHTLLRNHKIKKTYHAIVLGKWPKQLSKMDEPLTKGMTKSGERVVRSDEEGKEALTTFQLIQTFKDLSLIAAHPHTGRTHQIRVHTKLAKHPILGDDKYGDEKYNAEMEKKLGTMRLCLHAHKLSFSLSSGESYSVEAPYDEKWQFIIKKLQ